MIQTKNELKLYLRKDREVNVGGGKYLLIRRLLKSEPALVYHYLTHLRRYEYYSNQRGLFYRICSLYHNIRLRRLGTEYNIHIKPNRCGYGLRITHIAGGVIIYCKSVGNYCTFNSGVILGNNKKNDDTPTIGDNCVINPGVKIFGDVTIGNNSEVGANAVVTKSFPENSIIAGVPARLIRSK